MWEPLLALADAAGGDWPDLARRSAVALVAAAGAKVGGFGIQLLADLRVIFHDTGEDRLSTDHILERLCALDESPWADIRGKALDSRNLARRLAKYAVKPKQLRLGDKNTRGYERVDLLDAWLRYLPTADTPDPDVALDPRKGNKGPPPENDYEAPPALPQSSATSATSATALRPPTLTADPEPRDGPIVEHVDLTAILGPPCSGCGYRGHQHWPGCTLGAGA